MSEIRKSKFVHGVTKTRYVWHSLICKSIYLSDDIKNALIKDEPNWFVNYVDNESVNQLLLHKFLCNEIWHEFVN
jgi:hypothetical protein